MAENSPAISQAFADRLARYGFRRIGSFSITGTSFQYVIDVEEAKLWEFSVFGWVSFKGDGTMMRVAAGEEPLEGRIKDFQKSLNKRMSGRLSLIEHCDGDTQSWELEGWRDYTVPYGGGLIYAKCLANGTDESTIKQKPRAVAHRLNEDYNSPLSGISKAGKTLKYEWEAAHGKSSVVSARGLTKG